MVRTYELIGDGLRLQWESPDLGTASAALPQGAYTSLRTYGGNRLLRLGLHAARLRQSAAQLGAPPSELPEARARLALALALRAAGHAESRLRLTWAPPRLFVSVEPFVPLPASLYEEGVACVTVAISRERPQAKDTRFLAAVAAGYQQLPPSTHEGLIVAEDGSLLEGLSSNFFAVRGGVLHTEQARVLHGVTRALVFEIAAELLSLASAPVRLDQLASVSEAFITSVSRGIVPVVRIDGRTIGEGRPGPITRELRRRFEGRPARAPVSVMH
jgi:branched-chain amino acid aminotransferase